MSVRATFLDIAQTARTLTASDEVEQRWSEPSALREMTIGDLAGHLARGVFTVDQYLQASPPVGAATVSPAAYFVEGVPLTDDIHDELNTDIRARSHEEAAEGHSALLARLDESTTRVTDALDREPATRAVTVRGDTPMLLDDYLVARIVELFVHLDDLAASLGVASPTVSREAADLAFGCLLDMARLRHGDLAVLRALARRERGSGDVLHVF